MEIIESEYIEPVLTRIFSFIIWCFLSEITFDEFFNQKIKYNLAVKVEMIMVNNTLNNSERHLY